MKKILLFFVLISLINLSTHNVYSETRSKSEKNERYGYSSEYKKKLCSFGVVKSKDHDGLPNTEEIFFQINLQGIKPKESNTWMGDDDRDHYFTLKDTYHVRIKYIGGLYIGQKWTLKKGGKAIASGLVYKNERKEARLKLTPGDYVIHFIAVEKHKSKTITWGNAGSWVMYPDYSKESKIKKGTSAEKGVKTKEGKADKESTSTAKSKPRYTPPTLPPSVDLRTEPSGIIEANSGDSVAVTVTVRNNGSRRLTGIRMDIDGMEEIHPRKTALSQGESFSQLVNMPPVGRGMCGFHIFVYSNEGLKKFVPVIIEGKYESYPPFLKKLDSASVHKFLPDKVYYERLTEQFDQLDGRIASRRYATKSPDNSILILLNYHTFNEDLSPKRWEEVLEENKTKIGGTIKKIKDYPVVIERDQPGLFAGYFCFGRYVVTIHCTAHYADMRYFEDAVETILKNIGYFEYLEEARKIPRLDILDYDPERLTISASSETEFTVKVENDGKKKAENAAISLIDLDNQTIGFCKIGELAPHQAEKVKFKANIKADKEHKSRKLLLRFSASNTVELETVNIKVETVLPPKLSLKTTSKQLVINPLGEVEGFGLILNNEGDIPIETISGLELVGQDCRIEGEKIYIDENDTDIIETNGIAEFLLIIKYFMKNLELPQEGDILYYLKQNKDGPVLAQTAVGFKYPDNFFPKIEVSLNKEEISYDLTPKDGDEEEMPEEEEEWQREEFDWDESDSFELTGKPMLKEVYLASPFDITITNKGSIPAKNLEVVLTSYNSGAIASCIIPLLGPDNGFWRSLDEPEKIKKLPRHKEFADLMALENGKNKLALVISEENQEIFRKELTLNIKGLKPNVEDMGILAQLKAIQKEQKAFLKDFLLNQRKIEKFRIHLYAKGSETDIKYERKGSSAWDNINRQINLYAGDAVGERQIDELERLKYDLAHELAHLISFDIIEQQGGYIDQEGKPRKIPIWFVEGLAECAAMQWQKGYLNLQHSLYTTDYIEKLRRYVQQGNSPFDILHQAMDKKGWSLDTIEYGAVATFVEYIYIISGNEKIISIWTDAGKGGDIESTIKKHIGKTVTELKREWRRYLMSEYEFK